MITNITAQMEKIYKPLYITIIYGLLVCLFSGCASMRPPIINTYIDPINKRLDSIHNYRYFCISQTGYLTANSGFYANQFGLYAGPTKSTSPSSQIAGMLLKNGFIQVNEVNPDNAKETMIVSFGETGRRNVNLGYSIEVTIQFVSAYSQQLICTCTAEGQGSTEADDVRKAIQRALTPLFTNNKSH